MHSTSQLCERARRWSSLRADDELSELESALLDAHLTRCAGCREFARGAGEIAVALRTAPLQLPPQLAHLLIRRRPPFRGLLVAAVVTLVIAAGAVAGLSAPQQRAAAPKLVAMVSGFESPDELRALRRPLLVERSSPPVPRDRQVPGEFV